MRGIIGLVVLLINIFSPLLSYNSLASKDILKLNLQFVVFKGLGIYEYLNWESLSLPQHLVPICPHLLLCTLLQVYSHYMHHFYSTKHA